MYKSRNQGKGRDWKDEFGNVHKQIALKWNCCTEIIRAISVNRQKKRFNSQP